MCKLKLALLCEECLCDYFETTEICPALQSSSWAEFATLTGQWKDQCGIDPVQLENGKGFTKYLQKLLYKIDWWKGKKTHCHKKVVGAWSKITFRFTHYRHHLVGIQTDCLSGCLTDQSPCLLATGGLLGRSTDWLTGKYWLAYFRNNRLLMIKITGLEMKGFGARACMWYLISSTETRLSVIHA